MILSATVRDTNHRKTKFLSLPERKRIISFQKNIMKKILVPCDFSRQSDGAFQTAVDLASLTKGEIFLLHVIPVATLYNTGFAGEPIVFGPQYFAEVEAQAKQKIAAMRQEAEKHSLKVTTEIIYGDLTTTIRNIIQAHQVDMVVMGTSGASGLKEFFIGSNTEKVVRFSPVPVLATRTAIVPSKVKSILLPSTLGLNQTDYINKLKDLQKLFNATLHILNVNTPMQFKTDAEGIEALEEFAKHYSLTNYKLHFRSYVNEDEGIIDFASSEEMDLIAMATHARKGLAHLFNPSIAESVVNHAESAIWTYRLRT